MKTILEQLTQGVAIGSVAVTTATPFLNWANKLSAGQPSWVDILMNRFKKKPIHVEQAVHPLKLPFVGYGAYFSSVVPTTAIAIFSHKTLIQMLGDKSNSSDSEKILVAATAGGVSGLASILPEGVAQARQLTDGKTSSLEIMRKAWNVKGLHGIGAGGAVIVLREGCYVTGYLAMYPILRDLLAPSLGEHASGFVAPLIAGAVTGIVTTPMHCLFRFHKQQAMMSKSTPSYFSIFKQEYAKQQKKHIAGRFGFLFKGALPRSIATTAGTAGTVCATNLLEFVQKRWGH